MVRNSLNIENRICFDSDPTGGPDRSNPSEMYAREQNFVKDVYDGDTDAFMSDVAGGAYGTTNSGLKAEEEAAAKAQAKAGLGNVGSDRGLTMKDMAPINNPVRNKIAREQLAEQLARAPYTPPPNALPLQVALNTLQSKATQFMGPRISTALEDPTFSPVYGANNRVTGAADQYGNLIEGTDPMNSLGQMGDGGSGDDQMASIMPPVDDGSDGGGGGGGGGIGEIPSDELAIDYLQYPYYAYSGFGNQYNPYGFAQGTMVDLLQSRGMTQPGQADTLGLFGNPRDFA